jgi:tRNA pseudouridine13 synthase
MKLKCRPEDFVVEELTARVADGGAFALYRLTKRSLGTPEAIDRVLRALHLKRYRVGYGGLKDRHALTKQYVTIEHGPRRDHEDSLWKLEYLGQCAEPFTPHDIAANRFEIVMRDLSEPARDQTLAAVEDAARSGLPNYFDDQRFGSVGLSGEYIGAAWCKGDYERALWLALAEPCRHDRSEDREQKEILRNTWKNWGECKAQLARATRRSIVTYLVDHPDDFKRALALLPVDLRGLYLSAFQSGLWNRAAAELVRETATQDGGRVTEVPGEWGTALFPAGLSPESVSRLSTTELPLPSARNKDDWGEFAPLLERVVTAAGLEPRELRVKYPRDSFFSKGSRRVLIETGEITRDTAPDDLYLGRHQIRLAFQLPRGSYATILVKRITEGKAGLEE